MTELLVEQKGNLGTVQTQVSAADRHKATSCPTEPRTASNRSLAGKAGGAITSTGRLLEFGKQKHNRLLVSIANLMGLPEVIEFGSPDDGSGALLGLTA